MREETTLLLEKETKEPVTEKAKETSVEKEEKKSLKRLFEEKKELETVVETPNYDKIEELPPETRKRIFKLKKESEKKSKFKINKKLKMAIIGIAFCILGAFCITTSIEISKASQNLQQIESEYSASLASLIQKINSTETGNRMLSLFETFPEESLSASSFYESSNWFDRLCNFLSGLFGG